MYDLTATLSSAHQGKPRLSCSIWITYSVIQWYIPNLIWSRFFIEDTPLFLHRSQAFQGHDVTMVWLHQFLGSVFPNVHLGSTLPVPPLFPRSSARSTEVSGTGAEPKGQYLLGMGQYLGIPCHLGNGWVGIHHNQPFCFENQATWGSCPRQAIGLPYWHHFNGKVWVSHFCMPIFDHILSMARKGY